MSNIHPAVIVGVRMATDQLTKDELVALYMVATASFDPREVEGYEKIKSLFTEYDGTRMHADTLVAFDRIVSERMKQGKEQDEHFEEC